MFIQEWNKIHNYLSDTIGCEVFTALAGGACRSWVLTLWIINLRWKYWTQWYKYNIMSGPMMRAHPKLQHWTSVLCFFFFSSLQILKRTCKVNHVFNNLFHVLAHPPDLCEVTSLWKWGGECSPCMFWLVIDYYDSFHSCFNQSEVNYSLLSSVAQSFDFWWHIQK